MKQAVLAARHATNLRKCLIQKHVMPPLSNVLNWLLFFVCFEGGDIKKSLAAFCFTCVSKVINPGVVVRGRMKTSQDMRPESQYIHPCAHTHHTYTFPYMHTSRHPYHSHSIQYHTLPYHTTCSLKEFHRVRRLPLLLAFIVSFFAGQRPSERRSVVSAIGDEETQREVLGLAAHAPFACLHDFSAR